jgi:uncharacterized NAD(P)/FAD-binding protein YdhS
MHVFNGPITELVRRLDDLPSELTLTESASPTVVVVGGGFSGAMVAANIQRRANGSAINVAIVERQGAVGEGLAYCTRDPSHLLNVPAGRMSAWPDRPDDFVAWLSRRATVEPSDFLPRQWYGEYVRESLLAAALASESARLSVVFDEARRIARRQDGGWLVHFARRPSLAADAVILAIGHCPPPDPIGRLWKGPRSRCIVDPWRPFATSMCRPDEPIVILGSGLTAIDAVMSLSQEPRRAPITLISRRGLIPHAHPVGDHRCPGATRSSGRHRRQRARSFDPVMRSSF